ncbi:MAG: DUF4250 domain-containing protein [Lachnospiraceae bacterium]|nr:DUF4250 domain-containing protein [Lachnospiraceae bacterium]
MFPKDPQMLLSVLNMKLRDLYSSLDDLCDDMDADKDEIINIMEKAGYHYDADQNAFRPV